MNLHKFFFNSLKKPAGPGLVIGKKFFSQKANLKHILLTMPKEKVHLENLKSFRKAKKENSVKYTPGIIELQILGNGSRGSPKALYLFTDQARYLFNCGEGTQRLAHEHKAKLSKLEHIFITSITWDNIGGLVGAALTIQDIGVPTINLHGPEGIEKLFEATKRFAMINEMRIQVADSFSNEGNEFYEDTIMRVDYISIYPNDEALKGDSPRSTDLENIEEDDNDYYKSVKGFKRNLEITNLNEERNKKAKSEFKNAEEARRERKACRCFVCIPKEKKGTLILDKCIEFGVPPGPLYGRLKNGEDITLPNGNLVRSTDVKSPDCAGLPFLIIDCPTEEYIDSLVENSKLQQYQNNENKSKLPPIVIHFTPRKILENTKYLDWMNKFDQSTTHLLINECCSGMGSEGVHKIQYKLNLIDKNIFPLLQETNANYEENEDLRPDFLKNLTVPVEISRTLFKYNLRPRNKIEKSDILKITPNEYIEETMIQENDFATELEKLHEKFKDISKIAENEYPNLVFLGTGSSIPNKTRNTSGILLTVSSKINILLDCAEGTLGQLVRFYGNSAVDEILLNLKAIYVSHLHADHHLGLIKILQERRETFSRLNLPYEPLYLIAPQHIMTWLNLYNGHFEKITHLFNLIPNASLLLDNSTIEMPVYEMLMNSLNLKSIKTIRVKHCPNAFGVALNHESGWKITYSGDTMPCESLIKLGMDSDILIHEATMEDELKHEAIIKMHSTTSEAIESGVKTNAKYTILTHFSQRYAKVPKINNDLGTNVGIAFDNMKIRLCDLPKMSLMYPLLKLMFAEHYEEMELKTKKLLLRREKEIEFLQEKNQIKN